MPTNRSPANSTSEAGEDIFNLTDQFQSYVSKPEITDLAPNFLVSGSKNVLIDFAKRIISRNGYTLFGATNTGLGGIKSSFDWETSSIKMFPLRAYDKYLEFYWNSTWNRLKSDLSSAYLNFEKIWDNTEKIDVLLWVLGEANTWKWSGGVAKVRSSTSTTLKKQGVISPTLIAAVTMTVASPAVATSVGHGLVLNDKIVFSTTGALPTNVTAGTVYYVITAGLTADNFQFSTSQGGAAVNSSGTQSGTHSVYNANLNTTLAFVAGDGSTVNATITDSQSNFVNAGFAAGDTLTVSGSTANNRNFTIASVAAGTLSLIMSDVLTTEVAGPSITIHNGEPTWASSRFLTSSTRKITYNGVDYAYTGGEAGDTLRGLTAFPTVTLGDAVWQTPIVLANSTSDFSSNFKQNLIGHDSNQLILASTKSQEVYISKIVDYSVFTLTSPRAPGDPAKVVIDNYVTFLQQVDNAAQTTSSVVIGGGKSEMFKLDYKLTQDNASELVRVIPLKTAGSSGLVSGGAMAAIKNATVYISREPTLDYLQNVEAADNSRNVPLSDFIKNDFDSYDFTGSHIKYWKRAIYITLPAHGLLLIYDLQRHLWQPPQTIPVGRLSIIDDWLYGHSSITNETYKLFTGTDDNGVFISQVARFAYNNGGSRSRLKNLSEYWSDGYITANGELNCTINFGFLGAAGIKTHTILGNDTSIVTSLDASPFGVEVPGAVAFGGSAFTDFAGLPGSGVPFLRFWTAKMLKSPNYTEYFTEYTMNTMGGQFALVAHGSNQYDAGTAPVSHKK